MSRALCAAVASIAMLAAGCAGRPAGSGSAVPSQTGGTIITLEDAGTTVSLRVGQTLVVALEPLGGEPWTFLDYPETILRRLVGQDGAPGPGFMAVSAGRGTISAFNPTGCIGPLATRTADLECPDRSSRAAMNPPGARFVLTVVVLG
jgi:hypothetical protein